MLSCCLKCRKIKESKKSKVVKTKNGKNMFYQIVKCAAAKNWDLLKRKKLAE